jgi:hypothetical protein
MINETAYGDMVRKMFSLDDMSTTSTGPIGVGSIRTAAMDETRIRDAQARLDKTALPANLSWDVEQALGTADLEQASAKHDGQLEKATGAIDAAAGRREASGWGEDIGAPRTKSTFHRSDMDEPDARHHADGIEKETSGGDRWQHLWKNGAYIAGRCDSDDGTTMYFDQDGNETDSADVRDCFSAAY